MKFIPPDLSRICDHIVGIRPFRTGGIRIETERLAGNKFIVHNYGHGGSGITLSWGTAQHTLELAQRELADAQNREEPIAILGAGIIGLTTAYLLLKNGFQVRIYADKFTPDTTSDAAAAVWGPFGVEISEEPGAVEQFYNWQHVSFNRFKEFTQNQDPKFPGVSFVRSYYCITPEANPHKNFAPDLIPPILVEKIAGKDFWVFQDLLIEMPVYLPFLHKQVVALGAKITQTVLDKQKIECLLEKIIFNCTGLGSRELFDDQDLVPIKGQLITVNRGNAPAVMICQRYNENKNIFAQIPRPGQNKCVIGVTYEVGVDNCSIDMAASKRLLEAAQAFFNNTL